VNCREFVEFLMGYLDGELPDSQRSVFEEHMGDCPSCVTYLDTYRETVRLGRGICAEPEGPVPEDAPEDLVRAILAARREAR
jgi:anti-sigma factor RsiW